MKIQEEKGREDYQLFINRKVSVSLAKAMLWTACLPDEAMCLEIDSAIARHALKRDIIGMLDLNGFHNLIDYSNLNRAAFLDFAMHHRENSTYGKLSRNLMRNSCLGKINALSSCWYFKTNV